jgi:hypothetical protein
VLAIRAPPIGRPRPLAGEAVGALGRVGRLLARHGVAAAERDAARLLPIAVSRS